MDKLYLDIETTGLSKKEHKVTVVGAYDGEEVYQLVEGRDLNFSNLSDILERCQELVTFNGKRFDIPFIEHNYDINADFNHKDLMYLGWEIGWKGGLKKIEKELDIERSSGIESGSKAISLWKKYKGEGCVKSLKKLLKYNREDVVNLEKVEEEMEDRV